MQLMITLSPCSLKKIPLENGHVFQFLVTSANVSYPAAGIHAFTKYDANIDMVKLIYSEETTVRAAMHQSQDCSIDFCS